MIVIPESNKWSDFAWPEWVPQRERELIEEFWLPDWGRGPKEWAECNEQNAKNFGEPLTGERVRCWGVCDRRIHEGRYVHRWNNIGIVVDDSGETFAVSGVASDESVANYRERIESRIADLENKVHMERSKLRALNDQLAGGAS